MKAIESLLRILVQQGGTELRLASDRRPQMFKDDAELPFTVPAMSGPQIRALLGDVWTTHEAELVRQRRLSIPYRSSELGAFSVDLGCEDESALEIRVHRGAAPVADDGAGLPPALVALLSSAAADGASDLHLSPRQPPIVRINGTLHRRDGEAGFDIATLVDDAARLEQIRSGLSLDRALDVPGVGRVRLNVYASQEGLCAALRILARDAPTLAALQLPAQLASLVEIPHGLIIACGPTGSGKSTTLAALLQHALRARSQVLITLEDPIEYLIRPMHEAGLVRQREIGTHVSDFASGLRDALREDPDLLLVGEMRDAETISLALTAAETGHLVFASLHSRTTFSAVERIVDTYPPERQRQIRVQLADSLKAVVAQRLLPTVDGGGRIAAVELLRVTYGVANLIREGRTAQIVNAIQAGGNDGMLAMERSLADLVQAKKIRRETALAFANDPGMLAEYLRAVSP